MGAEAPCAAEQTARSSSFPRPTRSHAHRFSRLTCQHGGDGEQSGLVTLTFDLLTLKVVSESRVTWATSVPILVFYMPLSSRLRPDVCDRQTSDNLLMPPSIRGGGIKTDVHIDCELPSLPYTSFTLPFITDNNYNIIYIRKLLVVKSTLQHATETILTAASLTGLWATT